MLWGPVWACRMVSSLSGFHPPHARSILSSCDDPRYLQMWPRVSEQLRTWMNGKACMYMWAKREKEELASRPNNTARKFGSRC